MRVALEVAVHEELDGPRLAHTLEQLLQIDVAVAQLGVAGERRPLAEMHHQHARRRQRRHRRRHDGGDARAPQVVPDLLEVLRLAREVQLVRVHRVRFGQHPAHVHVGLGLGERRAEVLRLQQVLADQLGDVAVLTFTATFWPLASQPTWTCAMEATESGAGSRRTSAVAAPPLPA